MEGVLLHSYETPKRMRMEVDEQPCMLLDHSDGLRHGTMNHDSPMLDDSLSARNEASLKRGRPRAEVINHLIIEGSSSGSSIRCETCNRVFPREKSLQAHKRIHTGEKPYICDYPGCGKAFTQSGQLKTHQRLHTGEKPFICTVTGCNSRFTHANRHCADHPYANLRRCHELALQPLPAAENSPEVLLWLENYKRRNDEKTPGKLSDSNEEGTESRVVKKQIRSKNLNKANWMTNADQQVQQENVSMGDQNILNNRQQVPRRRGKVGIAKALQYGGATGDSSDESSHNSAIPLYRKLCEAVEPPSFGCTPLQWSPRKSALEMSSPSSSIGTPVARRAGDMSSGYESLLFSPSLDSSQENVQVLEASMPSAALNQTPVRPEKPKRRWLREALTSLNVSPAKDANLTRPSVIMTAPQKQTATPYAHGSPYFQPSNTSTPAKPGSPSSLMRALQNAEKQWSGAIALMQLASSPH